MCRFQDKTGCRSRESKHSSCCMLLLVFSFLEVPAISAKLPKATGKQKYVSRSAG